MRDHRKVRALQARLGADGVLSLVWLWLGARVPRPDGILSGWSADDVEWEARWRGEPGALVAALLTTGWLTCDPSGLTYSLHDWDEHQGWAVAEPARKEAARKAGKASGEARGKSAKGKGTNGNERPVRKRSNGIEPPSLPLPSLPLPSNYGTAVPPEAPRAPVPSPVVAGPSGPRSEIQDAAFPLIGGMLVGRPLADVEEWLDAKRPAARIVEAIREILRAREAGTVCRSAWGAVKYLVETTPAGEPMSWLGDEAMRGRPKIVNQAFRDMAARAGLDLEQQPASPEHPALPPPHEEP